jgi:atypical dual specificity phosphatase
VSDWFTRFGFAQVGDGLLIGAYPLDAADIALLAQEGTEVVYNLCEDVEYDEGLRERIVDALADAGIAERRLPLQDYGDLPRQALDRAVEEVLHDLDDGRTVYVHCRAGWQRSAAVAAGVIALREGVAVEEALQMLRERKPTAEPLDHQLADLVSWFAGRKR